MKPQNLERAGQIARELPVLKMIRKDLSQGKEVIVGERVLPRCVVSNLIAAVNAEINRMEKEIETL